MKYIKLMAFVLAILLVTFFGLSRVAKADCGTEPVEIHGKSWAKEWWGGKDFVTFIYLCTADGTNELDDLTVNASGALIHIGVVPVTDKEPTSVTPILRPPPVSGITSPPAYTPTAFTTPYNRQDVEPPQGFSNGWVVGTTTTCDATDQWYYSFTFLAGD